MFAAPVVLAADYIAFWLPNGPSASGGWTSDSDYCWNPATGGYTWTHAWAWAAETNTSTKNMTVNYLDFYGGSTSPKPVPPYGAHFVWGPDSWVTGNNANQSYRYGQLGSFLSHSFYSYDITLWLNRTFSYSSGSGLAIWAQFGALDGPGAVQPYCSSYSYLFLQAS